MKIGDTIVIKTWLIDDGKIECVVNNIDKGYVHANPIHPDGTLSPIEIVVSVNSKDIVS